MLNKPITALPGIGKAQAEKYARLGIYSLEHLLFHLPSNYQDRTQYIALGALVSKTTALIRGRVLVAEQVFRKRRSLLVQLHDGTGFLTLRFFYFNKSQAAAFKTAADNNSWVSAFGEVRRGPGGNEMIHPEYQISAEQPQIKQATLTPVYPLTEGITQQSLRKHILYVVNHYLQNLEDYFSEITAGSQDNASDARTKHSAIKRENQRSKTKADTNIKPDLKTAIRTLHLPDKSEDIFALLDKSHPAQKRLALEELLAHHLSLAQSKKLRRKRPAQAMTSENRLINAFMLSLQFELTAAQSRVIAEITGDLKKSQAMMRMVQGDVGSGKTVVAACAALQVIASGCQVALMAPTELLAEQHYRGFKQWFDALDLQVAFLNGRQKAKEKAAQTALIVSGEAQLIIGTHALFQESVEFSNLGLIIVDEQHRFGVNQRLALVDKGKTNGEDKQKELPEETAAKVLQPHQLIMTATPIPRSMAMVFYADMDVSTIDELPPGRTPVQTIALGLDKRGDVMERVYHACMEKRQAYWVCPLIEESEKVQAQAATDTFELLKQSFKNLRVGLIHGRMKSEEKDQIMDEFRCHRLDLLVATTVIEVGVDVPNASLMVIENAERLGLAQLHQLRGRVGRGNVESVCVLLYQTPLSDNGKQRIAIMRESTDGFKIAMKDLEIRGPGELLGTRQSGLQSLKVADLIRDKDVFPQVTKLGLQIQKQHPDVGNKIIQRWLPDSVRYAHV